MKSSFVEVGGEKLQINANNNTAESVAAFILDLYMPGCAAYGDHFVEKAVKLAPDVDKDHFTELMGRLIDVELVEAA